MKKIVRSVFNRVYFRFKATGDSMLPLFQPEDVILFNRTSFKKVRSNDVILIKKNNHYMTHRVIYKTVKYLITRGDNNLESDGKIRPHQVIARAVGIKRNGKEMDIENLYLMQSTLYFREIVKVKHAFEKENIDCVFLKGLPLHLHYEGAHPRRIYSDCDILVREKQIMKINSIFDRLGYKRSTDDFLNASVGKTEKGYYKMAGGLPVIFDVHFRPVFLMAQIRNLNALYPQKLYDQFSRECFFHTGTVSIQNEKFLILDTGYLVLYLALHFFHHNFTGIHRLEFIDQIIRKSRLKKNDWQRVEYLIEYYQFKAFIFPVFFLLKKYFQTPLPLSLTHKIKEIDIFKDDPRTQSGIKRFINIFFLSPRPFFFKFLILFNPEVLKLAVSFLRAKLLSLLKNRQSYP